MTAGVYRLTVGKKFYIGSSSNLKGRRADHQWHLRKGDHLIPELNKEYAKVGEFTFTTIDFLHREEGESDVSFRDRLRAAEQIRIDEFWGKPGMVNRSPDSSGPDQGYGLRERWKDPAYRAMMSEAQKRRRGKASPETRERMAAAKRGSRNAKSRRVLMACDSGGLEFDSTTAAAIHFGVSQQVMHLWLTGGLPRPSPGRRGHYSSHPIASYMGCFEDEMI